MPMNHSWPDQHFLNPLTDAVLCADPFGNDENFLLSMVTLEELGATGNKVKLLLCAVSCECSYQHTLQLPRSRGAAIL